MAPMSCAREKRKRNEIQKQRGRSKEDFKRLAAHPCAEACLTVPQEKIEAAPRTNPFATHIEYFGLGLAAYSYGDLPVRQALPYGWTAKPNARSLAQYVPGGKMD